MIPSSHKEAVVAYLAQNGEQRFVAICNGVYRENRAVRVTSYLLKKLCKEGRIEKVGFDTYRIPNVEGRHRKAESDSP